MNNEIIDNVIGELGENYKSEDRLVLQRIIDKVTANALFISNRKDINLLSSEIEECAKAIYLQRGAEDVKSRGESGMSSVYKNAFEELRENITKNGKRVVK